MRPGNRRGRISFGVAEQPPSNSLLFPVPSPPLKANALILLGSEKFFRENSLIIAVIRC